MDVNRLGVKHQKFLVPLTKPVTLVTLSYKTEKATKIIINLIALSSSQHFHLLKPTSTHFALATSQYLRDTTSLNAMTEISSTVPTDIQTPINANDLNYTSNFTQKSMLKIEAQLSALKSYVNCELSTLISKIKQIFKKEKVITLTLTFYSKKLHPRKTN